METPNLKNPSNKSRSQYGNVSKHFPFNITWPVHFRDNGAVCVDMEESVLFLNLIKEPNEIQ